MIDCVGNSVNNEKTNWILKDRIELLIKWII